MSKPPRSQTFYARNTTLSKSFVLTIRRSATTDRPSSSSRHAAEGERLDGGENLLYFLCVQGDVIGTAVHEADRFPIGDHLDGVSRQERTIATSMAAASLGLVQNAGALEAAATTDQFEAAW